MLATGHCLFNKRLSLQGNNTWENNYIVNLILFEHCAHKYWLFLNNVFLSFFVHFMPNGNNKINYSCESKKFKILLCSVSNNNNLRSRSNIAHKFSYYSNICPIAVGTDIAEKPITNIAHYFMLRMALIIYVRLIHVRSIPF